MERLIEVFLRGRKFKKYTESKLVEFRKKYDLKEIEVEMIHVISEVPECDTVASIYNYLNANKGHISRALFSLQEKGFINSQQDKNDRRYVHYTLNEKGIKAGKEITKEWENMCREIFKGISEKEIEQFKDIFMRIDKNIKKIPEV